MELGLGRGLNHHNHLLRRVRNAPQVLTGHIGQGLVVGVLRQQLELCGTNANLLVQLPFVLLQLLEVLS